MAAVDAARDVAEVEAAAAEPDQARRKRTPEEEAERLQRTLFLGNLPATVKAKLVKQTFSQCAPSLHPCGTIHHSQACQSFQCLLFRHCP